MCGHAPALLQSRLGLLHGAPGLFQTGCGLQNLLIQLRRFHFGQHLAGLSIDPDMDEVPRHARRQGGLVGLRKEIVESGIGVCDAAVRGEDQLGIGRGVERLAQDVDPAGERPARRDEVTQANLDADALLTCHSTLPGNGYGFDPAVCAASSQAGMSWLSGGRRETRRLTAWVRTGRQFFHDEPDLPCHRRARHTERAVDQGEFSGFGLEAHFRHARAAELR
jgi:hypothetical protein